MVGVGVTTYNRLPVLKECIERILEFTTTPYTLFVSDDGSTDGTPDYLKGFGRSRPNRGLAINRNRCLHELFVVRECDTVLMLDDDALVTLDGWELPWIDGAREFGHVSCDYREHSPIIRWAEESAGHCSTTAQWCWEKVGYYDTRYSAGWGYEDADYCRRASVVCGWPDGLRPVCGYGVIGGGSGEWVTEDGMDRNRSIYER